jgi:chitinase
MLLFVSLSVSAQTRDSSYRLIGYYTSWSIYDRQYFIADIPADRLTHINYAFANISRDGECIPGDEWADTQVAYPGDPANADYLGNFRQLNLLKAAHPHLQTLISVGGWTWSGRFSDAALTAQSRQRFARSCVAFMTRYGFDGIDLDWEYPTGGGEAGSTQRAQDPANFVLLLQEMRAQLEAQAQIDGREYWLTIAASAGASMIDGVDWEQAHGSLDWINVMTYDMSGAWSAVTGLHAPLYDTLPENPPEQTSTDTAMRGYVAAGVPPEKLMIGVPFYGRGFAGVLAENDGLHQPFERVSGGTWEDGVFDYDDLTERYIDVFTRYWHERAQSPYLFDAPSGIMITYDDPESLRAKVNYVRANGYGGVMFWELSADTDAHELLTTIDDALQHE